MATKTPMTNEAIALTEKKMDMSLDDIIKLSKKPTAKPRRTRVLNKKWGFLNNGAAQGNYSKVQRFMDSRSSVRQGVLAQRRSSFQGNQFPLATEASRKAAVAPIHNRNPVRNRVVNWNKPRVAAPQLQRKAGQRNFGGRVKMVPNQRPQTLDSLFANMKEQRMKLLSNQQPRGGPNFSNANPRRRGTQQQQQRGRGGRSIGAGSHGNFAN